MRGRNWGYKTIGTRKVSPMAPAFRMVIVAAALVLAGAGCGLTGQMPRDPVTPADAMQSIRLMQSYDADHDGIVTKEEMEAGLKREFSICDSNGDGRLGAAEMQAENDRRWKASGPASSPLIDWSQDGFIDFAEFATTARSVFTDLDRDKDGRLSANELRPPRQPRGRGPGRRGGEEGRQG